MFDVFSKRRHGLVWLFDRKNSRVLSEDSEHVHLALFNVCMGSCTNGDASVVVSP